MKKVRKIVIAHPRLHNIVKKVKTTINRRFSTKNYNNPTFTYSDWIDTKEHLVWSKLSANDERPLVSIVVPAFNTPEKYLIPLIESVKQQTYQNWELCLVDGSTNKNTSLTIREQSRGDDRINYIRVNENLGISGNTNKGLEQAKGMFVGLLDHDDILSPHAIEEVVVAYNCNKKAELIYSDEDKLSDDGRVRQTPFFKPDWSPELLLGVNYITHFLVVKKSLIERVGLLRSKYDGAQDYDWILRLTEKAEKIVHIPKVLYHWRLAEGSTASSVGEKNYADIAGQNALKDTIKRRKLNAKVIAIPERPTNSRLLYILPKKKPKVSIIIPFKDRADVLKKCINSIKNRTTYDNYEVILLSNNSEDINTKEYVRSLEDNDRIKVYQWNKPFNYSAINNFGVSKSSGEYLIFLNNDTEIVTRYWIEELIGVASQPRIGAVGPVLYYPNRKKNGIQHAGVVLGMGGMAGHVFRHHQISNWTPFGMPAWPRNYLAVTGACLVVGRNKFKQVGQFDETFIIAGQDVALCLSLFEKGYRNVYWPFAEITHHESLSVESYSKYKGDYDISQKYYQPYLNWNDPYYNKNLDLMDEQIKMRENYE